jgi:hypothetical protein
MMLFVKSGTLREALGLVRDEKMLDGQDPLVVMNGCSEAQMNAPVLIEIEMRHGKHAPGTQEMQAVTQGDGSTATLEIDASMEVWPTLLKMYVSVQAPPFRQSDQKEWYLFARRFRPEQGDLSGLLARMSERRLNFVMNVR